MTFRSARTTVARSLVAWLIFAVSLALAQTASQAISSNGSAQASQFVPAPSNPAPAYAPGLLTQERTKAPLPAIPMPPDRADDSYRIYTMLMPVGELGRPGWPRDLWLLSDTTLSLVAADRDCLPQEVNGSEDPMNPHFAVHPPADRVPDFNELLEDFDKRCHERIQLTQDSFPNTMPLRLLTEEEQDEFVSTRWDQNAGAYGDQIAAKYKGAPGISSFSQVYFNSHHTLAMVYATGWCGGLCVQSFWDVLEFRDGQWKRLPWSNTFVMS